MKLSLPEQIAFLSKGAVDIIKPGDLRAKLEKSQATGKPLQVKLGADPTSPDLHIGHTVVLQKLRQFQDLGHIAIFLIGDFTGMIGDPSGRSVTRPPLSPEQIAENAETYKKQVFKILDPAKTVIDFNSRWMSKMIGADWVRLAAKVTVAQILERDDFTKRMQAGVSISMHELLYPIVQGYDSVALEADVELGGTDQKFNLLVGRNLQREFSQEPQVVITTPLLEGLDGVQKMSKSYGNYIGINEPPKEIFGKTMSISDEMMWRYMELLTDRAVPEIESLKRKAAAGELNPRDVKAGLACELVARYHSAAEAGSAKEEFFRIFAEKQHPDVIPFTNRACRAAPLKISKLIADEGLAPSVAEARRLIEQGGVRVDGQRISDPLSEIDIAEPHEVLLQVGKRGFLRIYFEK